MKRIAPTETPATIPNRREYRAQGMLGNRCRSESGSMVRTASRTVAFCGCGVASAGEAEASGCCDELVIPSTVSVCLTIGTPAVLARCEEDKSPLSPEVVESGDPDSDAWCVCACLLCEVRRRQW